MARQAEIAAIKVLNEVQGAAQAGMNTQVVSTAP
jgi:hypothetical protein